MLGSFLSCRTLHRVHRRASVVGESFRQKVQWCLRYPKMHFMEVQFTKKISACFAAYRMPFYQKNFGGLRSLPGTDSQKKFRPAFGVLLVNS